MQSFYGGRRGQSFELVKTYSSISEMSLDFSSPNCTVYYGQYVTIDSTDADRGKIFKRTGNLNNGLYGAVYVGVLPSENGVGASLSIKPYNNIIDGEILTLSTANNDLISGKQQEETINIKYKTELNPETNKDETQIGLKLPYNVIDWYIDPRSNAKQVEIKESYNKPFHQAYLMTSPVALDGDKIRQLIQVTNDNIGDYIIYESPNSQTRITSLTCPILAYQIEKEILNDVYTPTSQDYDIFNPKIQGLYEYIAGEYQPSSSEQKVSEVTYYIHTITVNMQDTWYKLCDFNQTNITYDEDSATITIIGQDNYTTNIPICQIKNFSLDEQGYITITYVDSGEAPSYIEVPSSEITESINPKDEGWYELVDSTYILTLDTSPIDGKTYYKKAYEHSKIINDTTPLQWITDISYDNINESLVVTYNTGFSQPFPTPVNSVSKMSYDKNTGKIYVTYTRPMTIDNYELIEEDIPIEDFSIVYEISQPYYQNLQDKIERNEIKNYTEYKQEVLNICDTFKGRADLYVLTSLDTGTKEQYSYEDPNTHEITYWYKIYFNQNGQIIIPTTENIGVLRSIVGIDYTEEGLIVVYNTGEREAFDFNIRGVDDIYYDDNYESIIIKYSDGQEESLELAIRVTSVRLNPQNQLVFRFNDNTEITTSKSIEYPETIQFNNLTQKLEMIMNTSYQYIKKTNFEPGETNPAEMGLFEYNEELDYYFQTEDTEIDSTKDYYIKERVKPVKEISPAINYIQDVQINTENYELLILFSDPAQKGDITYNGIYGWRSLGYIKDQSGIFITEVLDSSIYNLDYGTISAAIESLNEKYPNGRNGNPHECVAVGGENESKTIFGYDNDKHSWYLLGRFSGSSYIAAATEEDYLDNKAPDVDNLPAGGLWFIQRHGDDDYAEYLERYGVYWAEY